MVALAIAGLALAALTSGASGGLRATLVAAHEQEAIARARSHMASLAASLVAGEQRGDDGGGFDWRVQAQQAMVAAPPLPTDPPRAGRAVLYDVVVTVGWDMDGARREVALSTRRVGVAPAAPP